MVQGRCYQEVQGFNRDKLKLGLSCLRKPGPAPIEGSSWGQFNFQRKDERFWSIGVSEIPNYKSQ